MKISILKEKAADEARVAATPETVKKLIALGATVAVEKGAGDGASFADALYKEAGATIAATAKATVKDADIVVKITAPTADDAVLDDIPTGAALIAMLAPYDNKVLLKALATKKLSGFALELIPRITRAQSMDILSSQSNLAGYRAVLEGATQFTKAFPMMMTAAGTIAPARVLILGVGVAGLQAIATARRLGAVVSAFDVRRATKEQVESLGATFIDVGGEDAETAAGYAKEVTAEDKAKQQAKIAEVLQKTDIVITTALIPGKPAPVLITEDMVKGMKPGSVIVDLAVERGGNCPLSEAGKTVVKHGVKLVGISNFPSLLATDASALFARNVLNFITLLVDKDSKALKIDQSDEIIKGTLLTFDGTIIHPAFAPAK